MRSSDGSAPRRPDPDQPAAAPSAFGLSAFPELDPDQPDLFGSEAPIGRQDAPARRPESSSVGVTPRNAYPPAKRPGIRRSLMLGGVLAGCAAVAGATFLVKRDIAEAAVSNALSAAMTDQPGAVTGAGSPVALRSAPRAMHSASDPARAGPAASGSIPDATALALAAADRALGARTAGAILPEPATASSPDPAPAPVPMTVVSLPLAVAARTAFTGRPSAASTPASSPSLPDVHRGVDASVHLAKSDMRTMRGAPPLRTVPTRPAPAARGAFAPPESHRGSGANSGLVSAILANLERRGPAPSRTASAPRP